MHPRWSKLVPKHPPGTKQCFSITVHSQNNLSKIFKIESSNSKSVFPTAQLYKHKNAFLRQCWQLTCLSIFHIMPNATRGVKYVTISNFSTSQFLMQGFILKKINFFQLLLPKCFKNKLKTFEKCLQKVEKIRKFFFLRNRF